MIMPLDDSLDLYNKINLIFIVNYTLMYSFNSYE